MGTQRIQGGGKKVRGAKQPQKKSARKGAAERGMKTKNIKRDKKGEPCPLKMIKTDE